MSMNEYQAAYVRDLAKIPAEEKCDCGWYVLDECNCSLEQKYWKARNQWLRFYREMRKLQDRVAELERAPDTQEKDDE